MSQRIHNVDESITINLQVVVKINSFSNHEGFKGNQIQNAIEEFKDEISGELYHKLTNDYYQQEFLQSVNFVNFTVEKA